MNNFKSTNLFGLNSHFSKFLGFIIKNKKILKLWYLTIFGCLFLVGFALYLYSGIGNAIGSLNIIGEYPNHNGVWYVQGYIGTGKELNGVLISNWESLASVFDRTGFSREYEIFKLSETLHTMYEIVLPIWIVGLVFLGIYFIIWFTYKFIIKKIIMKKFGDLFNFNSINTKSNNVNDNTTSNSINIDDIIKQVSETKID